MGESEVRDAWVAMPGEAEIRAQFPAGHPYDFGFIAGMQRLVMAHGRIGQAFGQLFVQIMLAPEGKLSRAEREMVAAVASAGQDCHY